MVSGITAAMVAWSRIVAEPRWSPDGAQMAWVEARAGRADVLVAPVDGSLPAWVATGDVAVRPVGGYGGGAFAWLGRDRLVVAGADGRLVAVPAVGGPATMLSSEGRAAAPAPSPEGARVAFVRETDESCAIVVLGLTPGAEARIVSDADYAFDPAWSADGRRLAWHEWDLPAMPWDASRIVVADPDGGALTVVAGGDGEAVGQPRWSSRGRLGFVTDRGGWANVWSAAADGTGAAPVLAEPYEHAEPTWGPGQRSFTWSPDGSAVALTRNEDGFGRLVIVQDGDVRSVARGWHHGLDWGPAGIAAVRSGARTPAAIVLDAAGPRRVIARGPVGGFVEAGLVEPEPVTWDADDGTTVHGLLYRPVTGESPPLLVDMHGGPTGQATVSWRPSPQFFASRGWAVLAPNPRGSTGFGRAYTQALAGGWGDLDVADVAAGIRRATAVGWGDAGRVAATGGSAGALTVLLLALRHPELLAAVVSQYGVADLAALAATTHRFESRYLDRLVGPLPHALDRYRERSPVTHGASIRVPLLVLQGDADRVVPPDQAEALVQAVADGRGTVEAETYAGEGHGWSRPETVADVYGRIEAFLGRHVLGGAARRPA